MKTAKRLAFWMAILICGFLSAIILDFFVSYGPLFGYSRRQYPVERLCRQVKPGMTLPQVNSIVLTLGRPPDIGYRRDRPKYALGKVQESSGGEPAEHKTASAANASSAQKLTPAYSHNLFWVRSAAGMCSIEMDSTDTQVKSAQWFPPDGSESQ